eukprot:scaffold31_cov263-Pinguiococcus_pyrenoidosus.AAC.10
MRNAQGCKFHPLRARISAGDGGPYPQLKRWNPRRFLPTASGRYTSRAFFRGILDQNATPRALVGKDGGRQTLRQRRGSEHARSSRLWLFRIARLLSSPGSSLQRPGRAAGRASGLICETVRRNGPRGRRGSAQRLRGLASTSASRTRTEVIAGAARKIRTRQRAAPRDATARRNRSETESKKRETPQRFAMRLSRRE